MDTQITKHVIVKNKTANGTEIEVGGSSARTGCFTLKLRKGVRASEMTDFFLPMSDLPEVIKTLAAFAETMGAKQEV